MSTPLKHSQNMTKHLTKAERRARQAAEASLQAGKRVYLRAPDWLSVEAKQIFNNTKKRLKGFDLLEAVDIDLLAQYADALARYQASVKKLNEFSETKEVQACQAWSRIALTYAEKLGFSQNARMRIARKRAQVEEKDELEQLLDDVSDYVNGGQ